MTSLWDVRRGEGPLVATAIHDGHDVRPEVAALLALSDDERRREEDPLTGRWTGVAPTSVVPRRSRFEVDLNRPPETAVYRTPADAWGLEVWRRPPDESLVEASLAQHRAFYDLVADLIHERQREHGRVVVLDLHSYNHRRGGPDAPPADPAANPVVNVGTRSMDRRRWAPLVDRFVADLRRCELDGRPLDVRENVRFGGGHLARWVHRSFPATGCALAVEVKKVYLDEWTGEPREDTVAALGRALAGTVQGLLESLDDLESSHPVGGR